QSGQLFTTTSGGGLGSLDLGGGQTEVRFTLLGDSNLDLQVSVGDLGSLATNYGAPGGKVWAQGDFDYNGTVDVGDLGALATSYGLSLAGGAATLTAQAVPMGVASARPATIIATAAALLNSSISAMTPGTMAHDSSELVW